MEWLGCILLVFGSLLGSCPFLILWMWLMSWLTGGAIWWFGLFAERGSPIPTCVLFVCGVVMVGAGIMLLKAPRWTRRGASGSGGFFVVAAVVTFLALACAAAAVLTIIHFA
jgi:hypothetical protein